MRRKPGALVPLEASILATAVELHASGVREFHGYQLARDLVAASDHRLLTAYGTLYRALARLETMGLLESHWEQAERAARENRPGRRLYKLTGAGAATARALPRERRHPRKRSSQRVAPA